MMKKILITVLALLLIALLTLPSLAWLIRSAKIMGTDPNGLSASSKAAYFESGNGSQDSPYVISNEVHLYNLAWLQYIGYFNKGTIHNNLEQTYFVLKNNIDAKDLTIPPIGTTEYPFIGNFNGNGNVIYNINTANILTAFSLRPTNSEFNVNSLLSKFSDKAETEVGNIMGFFGVVGSYSGEATGSTVDTSIIEVKNFGLTEYTLTSSSAATTVGIVAGYLSATLEDVLVGTCNLNTPNAANGAANTDYTSEYGLVGYSSATASLSESNVMIYDPTVTSETIGSGSSGGGTDGSAGGFGGSMDMESLARRLTYIYTENVTQSNTYPAKFYYSTRTPYTYRMDYEATSILTAYLASGSCLPLNVDTDTMFAGDNTTVTGTGGTYKTNTYYSGHSSEEILSTNTGYIVGGGASNNSNTLIRVRRQKLASGNYPGLAYSLGTKTDTSATFSRSNFDVLTIDPEGNTYAITDDYNGNASTTVGSNYTNKSYTELNLTQYENVLSGFSKTMNGKSMISALRFYTGTSGTYGIVTDDNGKFTEDTAITEAEEVSINDKPLKGYQMIDGAINFTLDNAGYITTLAGTYAESSGSHSFFSLFKIVRDESYDIDLDQSFLIKSIWVANAKDGTISDIQYNLTSESYNGKTYDCVYDRSQMNNLSQVGAAYYFELPVTSGEYAVGSRKGTDEKPGAYLMYLDIGTNGNLGIGGSTNPTTVISEYIEESENTYKYVDGVSVAEFDEEGNMTDNTPVGNMALQLAGNNKQTTAFSRTGDEISVSGGTLTMLGAGLTTADNSVPTPTSPATTVTQRRTYIHSDGAKITVTRTNNDDSSVTVTAKDSDGNDIENTKSTAGGVTTITTKQRTYTITWSEIAPTTAVLAYRYAAADGVTVTNSPVFTLTEGATTGSYVVTVSADTGSTAVTVTTNTDGSVAKGNTVKSGTNVTVSTS